MKALTLLGIILLSNLHVLTSDPSKSIDHLKKKSANPEVVKKHSAKTDTEHHEFKQKKEFHLENDETATEKKNLDLQEKIPKDADLTTHSTLTTSFTSSEAKDSEKGALNTKTDKKDKEPKSLKVRERKRKIKEHESKDSNDSESKEKPKPSHSKSKAKDSSAASSERVEDSIKHSIVEHEGKADDTPMKENSLKEKEKSPKADAVKDENTKHDSKEKEKSSKEDAVKNENKKHGIKGKEKSPKADAVKDENTKDDSKERKTKSDKKNAKKGRKKKFHPKKIVIADEVVAESLDEVSTKKHQATTKADQDAESENEEYLEEYNEYNLPDDDKVVDDARRRLKTRVTVSAKGAKKNSSPLPTSPSKSGKSTVRGKVTRPRRTTKSENRGTTRSSVSKHTLNAKVSKGATKNTPGTNAANKIASAKFGSEAPISVTESIMGKARSIQASGFKEKELTTCRNNTDCLGGKYCMFVHDANLRVCVEAKDVMRIYKDAVAYPHVDFPYENLLSRENKYQHCEANPDCDRESDGLTLHCQNMACLGKICVEDPINGCLSGFDCPEQYNCVRPSCGSQLQTEFGICIPLAPMARFY